MTSALRGKQAGNGIEMWGATLYDFYHVKRFPSVPGYISSSTGSRISKWMRQVGELIADDELYWADNEEDPKEIPVADIGELISCYDRRVALGIFNRFSSAKQQTGKPLPKIDSPFHPVHYPSPYPFIPCTHDGPPILQQRVPLHLLPQKLHVHDPWNKLTVLKGDLDHTTPWLSKVANGRGITRTYSLSLAPGGKKAALKAQKLAEMAEDKEAKQKRVLRIFPADKEGPMKEPLIEVVLPPQPRKRAQVEESHLYLSPYPVGVGNHSVVHSAEWELPRDLFVEARLCRACVEEDIRQQVQKLKDEGKWEALLKDPTEKPEETLHSDPELFFIEHPGVIRIASDYAGPAIRVHTTVKWRGPSEAHCKHGSFDSGPLPRTAIVRVVAKLSIPGDLHLAREAKNYQSFPDHFFQHWNGYNVTPPLHDPVPIGALCPQFYGYYEPDDPIDGTKSDQCDYLSPILLMEHCGRKVDPEALCLDDKQECASLVLRFHHAGWLHESFAARNILWQQGKPTEWPIERQSSVKKSFRLIDFGRSKKLDCAISERMTEGEIAFRLLHLLHHGVGR
ncbi:hypothetical protein DEU56DRAFT_740426 [Suillus clintonianus]|uniref:uncharacterized protein n=1 Tax=Suillus clintonianus TaxID=1904413 RepID=UPI001B85E65B|nr:uncharacterized protein DEU56DRAFT_740426 [Suillus clintonianus]KAG2130865.1 hypothetical protein DEU56DRAFT_740426 [Suillus clintonianus]